MFKPSTNETQRIEAQKIHEERIGRPDALKKIINPNKKLFKKKLPDEVIDVIDKIKKQLKTPQTSQGTSVKGLTRKPSNQIL